MNFKYKCLLQRFLSAIPKGEVVTFWFQKYVTNYLPVSDDVFSMRVHRLNEHRIKFERYHQLEENTHQYYEFGAGWDLVSPIGMALSGFEVTCIDIRKLVINSLIADTIAKFQVFEGDVLLRATLKDWQKDSKPLVYLKEKMNFRYLAPSDARNTGFNEHSFDLATSTATFEHIPPKDLLRILQETYRILKPGGILSLLIDYKDHYAPFDQCISIYNYLTYSEAEWKKYNPDLHYQNRLRHRDYLEMIRQTDFEIVEDLPELPDENDLATLKALELDSHFRTYTLEELGIKSAYIVLRK